MTPDPEPVLFLVDGLSGAGKSHFLRYAERTYAGVTAIRKHTTRPQRDAERSSAWSDLVHVSESGFREAPLDYRYSFRGQRYGFARVEIERALTTGPLCLVVVRDPDTIRRVARDLSGDRAVTVFIRAPREIRRQRLARTGASEEPEPANPGPAVEDPGAYEEIVENDGSVAEFHVKIDALIEKYVGSGLRRRDTG